MGSSPGRFPFIDAPIAFETDYEFYALFNDLAAAQAYAFTLIGSVSKRYREQTDVIFTLPYVGFHTQNTMTHGPRRRAATDWASSAAPGAMGARRYGPSSTT